jgi:hypothetical protein
MQTLPTPPGTPGRELSQRPMAPRPRLLPESVRRVTRRAWNVALVPALRVRNAAAARSNAAWHGSASDRSPMREDNPDLTHLHCLMPLTPIGLCLVPHRRLLPIADINKLPPHPTLPHLLPIHLRCPCPLDRLQTLFIMGLARLQSV